MMGFWNFTTTVVVKSLKDELYHTVTMLNQPSQRICQQTYNVGALWTEGKCSTGVDVGGVQKLQHTNEIGTVSLEKKFNISVKPGTASSMCLNLSIWIKYEYLLAASTFSYSVTMCSTHWRFPVKKAAPALWPLFLSIQIKQNV